MALRTNALALLLLTALLAIIADWTAAPWLQGLWGLPALALLAGLAFEAWLVARMALRVQVHSARQWLLGRPTPVRFEFQHQLAGSVTVQVAPSAPPECTLALAVRELQVPSAAGSSLELIATVRRLGDYTWPAMQVRRNGAFSLAWWSQRLTCEASLCAVPDVLGQAHEPLAAQSQGLRASARIGSGAEIVQLREYRSGDPPRAIDWKASARSRRLMSREFAEDQHLEIMIALDAGRSSGLGAGNVDRLALYANVAARLAQRAIALDDRVGLLIYADRALAAMHPGRGVGTLVRLRALLAAARVQAAEAQPTFAALRIRQMVRQRALVVLLTDLDDASSTGELLGATRLLLPKHLPFLAGIDSERAHALAARVAREEATVYQALAADEYGQALSNNARALRALGAEAVLAPPARLDQAVLQAYANFRNRRRI